MFGVQQKQLDMEHQNPDQRWDGEKVDTEIEEGIPSLQSKSAAKKDSKSSPCCCGKSGLPEPGGPCNKASVSCLQAISSRSQSLIPELAMTSKIPHGSRCNKIHPEKYHNKHKSERVKGEVLDGSTHGEASKQERGLDAPQNTNKEEIVDSEHPVSVETLDGFLGDTTTPIPFLSTCCIPSSDSEEDEGCDASSASRQETHGGSDSITSPRSFPRSLSHSTYSLHGPESFTSQLSTSTISVEELVSGDECSLTSLLEPTTQPHGSPLPPMAGRGCRSYLVLRQHPYKIQTRPAYSPTIGFLRRPSAPIYEEEEAADHEGTSNTDTLQSVNETREPSTTGQLDDEDVEDVAEVGDIEELVRIEECQAEHEGATAAMSPKECSKEIVCRHKQSLLVELSSEEEKDLCRICHDDESSPTNPLISPCLCSGSLQFIHLNCLKKWIRIKIQSGSGLCVVNRCELCLGRLKLDQDKIDWHDYYRNEDRLDISDLYDLRETTEVLINLSSLFAGVMMPAVITPFCPVPRIRIWPLIPYLIRRRIRLRRTMSQEITDT